MENILTKALKEVLTSRYSEELRDSSDTGHALTEGFETKMRELIRRVDRPKIHSYTRYIAAAAACAVIGIGAAVIIPGIMNNRVEVAPEQTSSITSETPDITHGSVSISDTETSETDAPESSETINDVTTSETTDNEPTSETDTSADIPSAEVSTVSSSDTTSPAVVDDDGNDINPSSGGDVDGPDSDDDVVSDESEDDVDSDDDLSLDVDGDDAAPAKVEIISVSDGDTLGSLFSDNFKLSFDDLYAVYGRYDLDQDRNNTNYTSFSMYYSDLDFVQDFVHKLGSAKVLTEPETMDFEKPMISLHIGYGKPEKIDRKMQNYSYWLRYKDYFAMSEEDEEDEDDYEIEPEEDVDDEAGHSINLLLDINIYSDSGRVNVQDSIYLNGKFYTFGETTFIMDMDEIEKLFGRMSETVISKDVKTVGDITKAFGITESSITSSTSVSTSRLYDTWIEHGNIGKDYIVGLLKKYAGSKLSTDPYARYANGITYSVVIDMDLKNDARLSLYIRNDGYMYISDGISWFKFKCEKGEIENAMNAISAANGFDIKLYSTLGEYLSDKNFNSISEINWRTSEGSNITEYGLTDKTELKKFIELIRSEFDKARYTYEYIETEGSNIIINVPGYRWGITLNPAYDIIDIGQNRFRLSSGFGKKFKDALSKVENAQEKTWEAPDVEEDCTDDVDYEDTPLSDDDADRNPIT